VAAIIEAAGELLVQHGYARVSTNLIARRAGVSVGSLYQYFGNKEAIYAALLDEHVAVMRARGEQALAVMADPHRPFAASLREVLLGMVAAHDDQPDLMRAVELELGLVFPHLQKTAEEGDDLAARIAAIIADRPDCRAADPEVAGRLVLICCQEVTRWLVHRAPGDVVPDPYVDGVVRMCALAAGHDPASSRG
jgi:AcrR family transcriptional regulator